MSKYYEIVIFTAGLQEYADFILNKLDPENKLISHRLYRQHCILRKKDGVHLKDLNLLGRDLKRTIIVDNIKDNFCLQRENGILINTWLSDMDDRSLLELIPFLREIVIKRVKDVKKSLQNFRDSVMRYIQLNKPQRLETYYNCFDYTPEEE